MKGLIKNILILGVLGFIVYTYREPLRERIAPLIENIRNGIFSKTPCVEPIPYKLGSFDTKFGISQKYFLDALTKAEAIWEKPYGKELFVYAPEDTGNILKVNLVYDYRQQATSKLSGLGIEVENNRSSYDSLKAKFASLKTSYEKAKESFNAKVQAFNQRQSAYEKEVEYWNDKGGAPKSKYDELEAERQALSAESNTLQTLQKSLNNQADEINAMVTVLNRLAGILNIAVDKYNTIGASRGESFEEGVYSSDGLSQEIDIYEFSSQSKLVRVLAHELGHALGLDHVEDTKAIMYKLNQGNTQALTEADLSALKAKCAGAQ